MEKWVKACIFMKLQPQGSFTDTESLECQEWFLISSVLWEVIANLWLYRTDRSVPASPHHPGPEHIRHHSDT